MRLATRGNGMVMMHRGIGFMMLLLLVPALAGSKTEPAPRGWQDRIDGHWRIVERAGARIEIGPWQALGQYNLRAWLASHQAQVPPGATLVSVGKIKPERSGELSVTRKVRYGSASGQSVLIACPGRPGVARLLKMHTRGSNLVALMSGGYFVDRVCKRESKGPPVTLSKTGKSSRSQEKSPSLPSAGDADGRSGPRQARSASTNTIGDQVNTEPGGGANRIGADRPRAAVVPAGFTEIQGLVVMGMQPGGMFGTTEDFIALFDDGSYTTDVRGAFAGSLNTARRAKPGAWGQWRRRGGKLQLRRPGKPGYKKPIGNWRTTPATPDQRLSGCFGRLSSTSGGDYNSGTTVGVASTWCFWPNGRFTNSSTAFGHSRTGTGVTMRATSPKARGRYRLDGYGARFVYDDGHEVRAAFCFANDDNTHIALNGRRFMGPRR